MNIDDFNNSDNSKEKVFWLMALINKIASFFGIKIVIEKLKATSIE